MNEILIFSAGIIALIWFSFTAGKNKEIKNNQEGVIDAITSAKEARALLDDPDVVDELHDTFRK